MYHTKRKFINIFQRIFKVANRFIITSLYGFILQLQAQVVKWILAQEIGIALLGTPIAIHVSAYKSYKCSEFDKTTKSCRLTQHLRVWRNGTEHISFKGPNRYHFLPDRIAVLVVNAGNTEISMLWICNVSKLRNHSNATIQSNPSKFHL